MKKYMKALTITSILLTSSTLFIDDQKIAYAEDETENTVSESDRILALFTLINEVSTGTDIQKARQLFGELTTENRTLIATEIPVIEAKIAYAEKMNKYIADGKALKTEIDLLQFNNPNFITATNAAKVKYDALVVAINQAQTDFKTIYNQSNSVRKSELASSLLHYNNLDEQNEAFIKTYISNNNKLQEYSLLTYNTQNFIDEHIHLLLNLSPTTYKVDVTNAVIAYNRLTANEKIIVEQYTINGSTPTMLLTNAEKLVKSIGKVDQAYVAVQKLINPTSATFISKVKALQTAVSDVEEKYHPLFSMASTELTAYTNIVSIMNEIDGLGKISSSLIEGIIEGLEQRYSNLTAIQKGYVTNSAKLVTARADLTKAQKADQYIANITRANLKTTLSAAQKYYKTLTATQIKMMQNEALLKSWEKSNTSAGLVINKISKIKVEATSKFVKDVQAAVVEFEKLGNPLTGQEYFEPTETQRLVYNFNWLEQLLKYEEFVNDYLALNVNAPNYSKELARLTNLLPTIQYEEYMISEDEQSFLNQLIATLTTGLKKAGNETSNAMNVKTLINEAASNTIPKNELVRKIVEARTLYNDKNYLTANGKKLVTNFSVLASLEKQYNPIIKVTTEISQLEKFYEDKGLGKKIIAANKSYSTLSNQQKEYVYNYNLLSTLTPIQQMMAEIDVLNVKNPNYRSNIGTLKIRYRSLVQTLQFANGTKVMTMLDKNYFTKLTMATTNINKADNLIDMINRLKALQGRAAITMVEDITVQYKMLNSEQKTLVSNYKDFADIAKRYANAIKIINAIQTLPELNEATVKTFATKIITTQAQYTKLTTEEKLFVYNIQMLEQYKLVAPLMLDIANLKVSNKEFRGLLQSYEQRYEALHIGEKQRVINYPALLKLKELQVEADKVIALIQVVSIKDDEYITKLTDAREAYNQLAKDAKTLVTNYSDLTAKEKLVKPVLQLDQTILNLLDYRDAKTFISKYEEAQKAYLKLNVGDRALLLNEKIMITELPPLYIVMKQISVIKMTSSTFIEDVKAARAAYTQLNSEQKSKIWNLPELVKFEMNVDKGASVDAMIKALKSQPTSIYIQKVKEARAAYNLLTSENKKAVTMYSILVEEEKFVKAIETAIASINQLLRTTSNISAAYDKTQKILDKLSVEQLALVSNLQQYQLLDGLIRVIELIDKIKPSDKYYIGNTQAAKLAYDKLTPEERMRVSNSSKLEDALVNIQAIQQVIDKIAQLSSESNTYRQDVEAVLAAYNRLPSTIKNQVSNYSALVQAQNNLKLSAVVMKQIDDIDRTLRTFESKIIAARSAYEKLTDTQKDLVTNISLLLLYEKEIGIR